MTLGLHRRKEPFRGTLRWYRAEAGNVAMCFHHAVVATLSRIEVELQNFPELEPWNRYPISDDREYQGFLMSWLLIRSRTRYPFLQLHLKAEGQAIGVGESDDVKFNSAQ